MTCGLSVTSHPRSITLSKDIPNFNVSEQETNNQSTIEAPGDYYQHDFTKTATRIRFFDLAQPHVPSMALMDSAEDCAAKMVRVVGCLTGLQIPQRSDMEQYFLRRLNPVQSMPDD